MEKVVLVSAKPVKKNGDWSLAELSSELRLLTRTLQCDVLGEITCHLHNVQPALYLGKGKAEEVGNLIKSTGAEAVIFNNDLSPTQQRNKEDGVVLKARLPIAVAKKLLTEI